MVAPALAAVGTAIASKAPTVLAALKGFGGKLTNAADIFSNWASGSGKNLLNIGGNLGNYIGSFLDGKNNNVAAQAYQSYLNGIIGDMASQLEARAEKYDQKLQNQFNEAEPQFQEEANTQLPELQKLMEDIATQNTETQRGDLRRINAILAQQGVRGGQAAILANRAMGETSRDTMRDINQLAYNDAANRQNSRLDYYSKKALTPWSAMSSAYGNSMVGANNALSQAQGNVYQNAYSNAMANYGNTQKKKGLF